MQEQLYSESDIPFEDLERFGLTRQMIEDLPLKTQQALLRGEHSPVLPLRIRVGKKVIRAYSRIRLAQNFEPHPADEAPMNTQGKVFPKLGIVFLPRLNDLTPDLFTQNQIGELYSGAIVKTVPPDPIDPTNDQACEYYCQLDSQTRKLLVAPSERLEYNMKEWDKHFQLNKAERQALISGKPLTVYSDGNQISFGVDLRLPEGIRQCNGNIEQWQHEFDNHLSKQSQGEKEYHFATYGCWVESEDGLFQYVDEDDYDSEILDKLKQKREQSLQETASRNSFSLAR